MHECITSYMYASFGSLERSPDVINLVCHENRRNRVHSRADLSFASCTVELSACQQVVPSRLNPRSKTRYQVVYLSAPDDYPEALMRSRLILGQKAPCLSSLLSFTHGEMSWPDFKGDLSSRVRPGLNTRSNMRRVRACVCPSVRPSSPDLRLTDVWSHTCPRLPVTLMFARMSIGVQKLV